MIFDPDHMSVYARDAALNLRRGQRLRGRDLLPQLEHRGHSAADLRARRNGHPLRRELDRLRREVAAAAQGLLGQAVLRGRLRRRHERPRPPGRAARRRPAEPGQLPVPVLRRQASTLDRQRSGERVFDINTDGVAHYGLYPDWIEDLRMLAGDEIVDDMGRGAEAYLQMWERADGIEPVACDVQARRTSSPAAVSAARSASGTRPSRPCGAPASRSRGPDLAVVHPTRSPRKSPRNVAAVFDRGGIAIVVSTMRRNRAGAIAPADARPPTARARRGRSAAASGFARPS